MSKPLLIANALEIGYADARPPRQVIAAGLNLNLAQGEYVCLVGPNGVGKSTLLRTITGLQPALGGEISLNGKRLEKYTRKELASQISVVLTSPITVGAMTVKELVAMGRFPFTGLFDRMSDNDWKIVQHALDIVGLSGFEERGVHKLSDGERQRAMIARALAQEPRLLVLDEPTAFLDLPGRISIMHLLRDLSREHQQAVLTSTHDLDLAMRSADRIWLMDRGGNVMQGSPEDLVLGGHFEHTFGQANLRYNMLTGQFEEDSRQARPVVFRAEGLAGAWTARALRRAGFEVLVEGAPELPLIELKTLGNVNCWSLTWQGVTREVSSIYALLAALAE